MRDFMFVGIGSAIGGILRYALVTGSLAVLGPRYPIGTLLANVVGSALIGLVAALARTESRYVVSAEVRAFLAVGFCGGFTTYSFFSWQVMVLGSSSALTALGYVVASLAMSLLSVWAAYRVTAQALNR